MKNDPRSCERNLCNCVRSLAKSTKLKTSFFEMSHSEKMPFINLFQTKGLEGLAISDRFSRSAIKIAKKATVVLVPICDAMCLYEMHVFR